MYNLPESCFFLTIIIKEKIEKNSMENHCSDGHLLRTNHAYISADDKHERSFR